MPTDVGKKASSVIAEVPPVFIVFICFVTDHGCSPLRQSQHTSEGGVYVLFVSRVHVQRHVFVFYERLQGLRSVAVSLCRSHACTH